MGLGIDMGPSVDMGLGIGMGPGPVIGRGPERMMRNGGQNFICGDCLHLLYSKV